MIEVTTVMPKCPVQLWCCSADDLLELLEAGPQGRPDFAHADPPWAYSKAAPPGHGRQAEQYDGLPMRAIAKTITRAASVVAADCYLALWCVWPMLEPWILAHAFERAELDGRARARWSHLTGGSWEKTDGRRGIGHHLLGECEPLLIYRTGLPRPQVEPIGNAWHGHRGAHSAKPVELLIELVRWGCPPGGLVLDLYAGGSATLARACVHAGRRYIGCELDPAKHARASLLLTDLTDVVGGTP